MPVISSNCPCFTGTQDLTGTFAVSGINSLTPRLSDTGINKSGLSFVQPTDGWLCGEANRRQDDNSDLGYYREWTMRYGRDEAIILGPAGSEVFTFATGVKAFFYVRQALLSVGLPVAAAADVETVALFSKAISSVHGYLDCSNAVAFTYAGQHHTESGIGKQTGVFDASQATVTYTP